MGLAFRFARVDRGMCPRTFSGSLQETAIEKKCAALFRAGMGELNTHRAMDRVCGTIQIDTERGTIVDTRQHAEETGGTFGSKANFLVVLVMILGVFVAILNETLLTVALSKIMDDLAHTRWQFAFITAAISYSVIMLLNSLLMLGIPMLMMPVMTSALNELPPPGAG